MQDDFYLSYHDKEILEERKLDQKAYEEWYDSVERGIRAEQRQRSRRRPMVGSPLQSLGLPVQDAKNRRRFF